MSVYSLLEGIGEFPFCTFNCEEIEDLLLQCDHIMLGTSVYHDVLHYGNESFYLINIACSDNFTEYCLSKPKISDLLLHRYKYIYSTTSLQEGISNGNKIISILNQFPHEDSLMSSIEYLLQAQVCHAAFAGDCDNLESFQPYVQVCSEECLHYAAAGGHLNIVSKLIEDGCPVDKTNSHGQTPLHVAALFGRTKVVVELLRSGADIDKAIVEDYTCCPPLDGVVNGLPEHLNTVLALLDEGCSFGSYFNVSLLISMRERSKLMLELREEDLLVDSLWSSDADPQTEQGTFRGAGTTFKRSSLKLIRTRESKDSKELVFGSALHQAALRGHLDTVQVLLEWNCDPCSVDSLGRSALHVAACANKHYESTNLYVDVVSQLVLGGCPVNMKCSFGCTPLHYAAYVGQSGIVTELLKHGADKDACTGHSGTPLHQAALRGHLLTLKALLDEGSNVCAVDENDHTPLHWAARNGQVGVAMELLLRGCPMNVVDNKGCTPLHIAAANGQSEMALELIRNGAEKDIIASGHGSPFHFAASEGHFRTVAVLLDEGYNVSVVDEDGRTPLHLAAAKGHVDVARELITRGCPVDKADNEGFTPLHDAAYNGQSEVVLELIKNCSEKDFVAGAFGSPLHRAAYGGHLQTVRVLLDKGYVNSLMCKVEESGSTPLHLAAGKGHVDVARELLLRGCPVDVVDNKGFTPLHEAACNGQSVVVLELMRNYGDERDIVAGKYGSPLHQAASNGHLQSVAILLNEGCNVTTVDDYGKMPIHWAAINGHVDVVRELIIRDCPVDIADNNGCTPLHNAAANGQSDVVIELITNHGAEKDSIAGGYGSPLHQAASNGHLHTVTVLLDEGCIVTIGDNKGRTPLHWVSTTGHVDVARELITRGCPMHIRDNNEKHPLHYAACKGPYGMVVELVTNPAARKRYIWPPLSMGALNLHGSTALHLAAQRGDADVVREILRRAPGQVDVGDKSKRTPLHDAAANGQTNAAVELIKQNADKNFVADGCGTPLHEAVRHGHLNTLKCLLQEGCSVHVSEGIGLTALHLATKRGNLHMVKELIKYQSYINEKDKHGRTPLHNAAAHGFDGIIVKLIKNGADKNIVCGLYGTPLHDAVTKGHVKSVKLLLNFGCNALIPNTAGVNAYGLAVEYGFMSIVEEINKHPLSANMASKDGRTLLHYVVLYNHPEWIAQLCKQGVNINCSIGSFGAPLHQAAGKGCLEAARVLLDAGCDVHVPDKYGRTALHWAASEGHVDVVRELVERSCSTATRDKLGRTPLHNAAANGQSEMVVELIRNGAEKNSLAGKYGSPLHQAANGGHLQTMIILLDEGCNVSVVDEDGRTPLHWVSTKGHVDVIGELIGRGCPVDKTDNKGFTPLHDAACSGQSEVVVELIRKYGVQKDIVAGMYGSPLHQAARSGHLQTVKALLGENCIISICDKIHRTPLHWVSTTGHVDVARELITRGCPMDTTDNNGETPLHLAAYNGPYEMVVELITNERGRYSQPPLSMGALNEGGSTVLHLAAQRGDVDVIRKILKRASGQENVGDKSKRTPLHDAAAYGQTNAAVELINQGADKNIIAGTYGTPLHEAISHGHLNTLKCLLQEGCSVHISNGIGLTALHLATIKGSLHMVKELIKYKSYINTRDAHGHTPLYDATVHGFNKIIVELINNGADKDIVSGLHGTPLHEAVTGHVKTVSILLDLGCNALIPNADGITAYELAVKHGFSIVADINKHPVSVNMASKDGRTLLHHAVFFNNAEWIAQLCQQGVNINCSIGTFGAPLHQAAGKGCLEAARALLDAGCDVHVLDERCRTPLHWAASEGHVDVVRELVEWSCSTDARDRFGRTPLHDAAANGQSKMVQSLISHGAAKNIVAGMYGTPLHEAAIHGHLYTLKCLLQEGCSVHVSEGIGLTTLHLATIKGNLHMVNELIKYKSYINTKDMHGRTPLHDAAAFGFDNIIVELIKNGADKDIVSELNSTPLHEAVTKGHLKTVKLLLDLGCNALMPNTAGITAYELAVEHGFMSIVVEINKHPHSANMTSKDGRTLLHYAVSYNKPEWIAQLCQQGVNINCSIGSFGAPLHQAAGKGCLEAVRTLLDAGCDVHLIDQHGRTPLHWAASEGYVDVVRELCTLERSSSTGTMDNLGRSALHDAAANGHTEAVIELVKRGADVNIVVVSLGKQLQETDGYTPLHFAAQYGRKTVVVELIRWGADKNPVCGKGQTPLHLAGSQGHVETFISLLNEGCDMQYLGYSFITAIEKHPKTTTRVILTALLERGFTLNVSQAPLLSRPLALAKKKQLQTMKFEIQDKPSWFQHYHRALSSHGYVHVNIIRCVLVGPPKVGKSCLKHLLVHNKSKRVEHSTAVMESPDVVSFSRGIYLAGTQASSSSSWKYVSDVDMGAILKGWTESESYLSSDGYPKSTADIGLDTKVKLFTDVAQQSHMEVTKITRGIEEVNAEQIPKQSSIEGASKFPSAMQLFQWDLKVQHCHLVSKMREFESHITGREAAFTAPAVGYTTLVNLIDSGGQPSFMDTLPLLLGTPCTYVHVFNASKDVDSPAEMTYRDKHGQETVMECKETTWELMLRSFSSVHTLKYKCTKHLQDLMEEGKSVPQCRIAIVGTFKDELIKCPKHKKVIASLNAQLEGLCKNMHCSLTFINNDQSNCDERFLFLVNNLLYEDGQDKKKCAEEAQYVDSLRDALSSEKAALQLKIPLMWLMLELVTRRSGVKYIKYKELKSFCLDHGYIDDNEDSEDQLRALLMLFHDLGFYAYYELKGVEKDDIFVCTEATALFKEVSKLLIIHFITPKSTAAQHFQETGEILMQNDQYKELFSEIDIDPVIDKRWFLMVVHHLGLAAKVSNSAYFVPLALPYGRVNLDVECTVAELCFTLKSKETFSNTYHLPRSVFPRLIVILSNDRDNWEPDLPRSARTTVKFIHRGAHVYITELATLVEVTLILPQVSFFGYDSSFIPSASDTNKLHSLCSSIRSALTKAMGEACQSIFGDRYTEDAFVTDGFLCSHCERSRETPHLAEPSKSERMPLVCSNTKELFPMSPAQRIWLAEIEPTSVQVQLCKDIPAIGEFWLLENRELTVHSEEIRPDLFPGDPSLALIFDQRSFMANYKDRFLSTVSAEKVADELEDLHVIDPDTCEEIKRALPSKRNFLLYKHMRDHSSLETVWKMCDVLINTGRHGFPQVEKLGEDMKNHLQTQLEVLVGEDSSTPEIIDECVHDIVMSDDIHCTYLETPSDVGLKGVLELIQMWAMLAESLGVPVDKVEALLKLEPETGPVKALSLWRDGQYSTRDFPPTWSFLLAKVSEVEGSCVRDKIAAKVATDKTWTL